MYFHNKYGVCLNTLSDVRACNYASDVIVVAAARWGPADLRSCMGGQGMFRGEGGGVCSVKRLRGCSN